MSLTVGGIDSTDPFHYSVRISVSALVPDPLRREPIT